MSTRSSQPHRLFLPVVTPTSFPRVWSSSPMSWRKQDEQTVHESQAFWDHRLWMFFLQCSCSWEMVGWTSLRHQKYSAIKDRALLSGISFSHGQVSQRFIPNKWRLVQFVLGSSVAKPPLDGAVWKQSYPPSPSAVYCTYQVITWIKGIKVFQVLFEYWWVVEVTRCVFSRCSALRGKLRCRLWWCTPWRPRKPPQRSEEACPDLYTPHPPCSWMKSQMGTSLKWHKE